MCVINGVITPNSIIYCVYIYIYIRPTVLRFLHGSLMCILHSPKHIQDAWRWLAQGHQDIVALAEHIGNPLWGTYKVGPYDRHRYGVK